LLTIVHVVLHLILIQGMYM